MSDELTPITRKETFLAKAGGQNVATPTPITREETFLQAIIDNGSGGGGGTGGGVLVCSVDSETGALDKTWKEIHDASFAVIKVKEGTLESSAPIISTLNISQMYYVHVAIGDGNPNDHTVSWILEIYETNSENGYPVVTE